MSHPQIHLIPQTPQELFVQVQEIQRHNGAFGLQNLRLNNFGVVYFVPLIGSDEELTIITSSQNPPTHLRITCQEIDVVCSTGSYLDFLRGDTDAIEEFTAYEDWALRLTHDQN